MDIWSSIVALSLGLGLSAACGFRVFIPPLAMGVGARAGLIDLGESWSWMGETWVMAIFAVATLLEIGAYYIPWLDNLMDTITTPSAIIAGIIVTSSSLDGMDPTLQWILAIVAGGGTSGTIQLGTVATRAVSTATTGGIANPLVSTVEAGACILCTILALLLPVIAAFLVVALMFVAINKIVNRKRKPSSNIT
ncbi:MAG: DUF4126 domain-containing protein [Candidatus Thalassarchaeaceae archaeon]|jgi:hypothetical protein|nr:DUF4126 domain-containing protein [Candidatus Thalassarchaeaceae archaeon]HJM87685.1 DUF4126 domain-containing protein [Candidatus Thalassarchaeaceae archaeon]